MLTVLAYLAVFALGVAVGAFAKAVDDRLDRLADPGELEDDWAEPRATLTDPDHGYTIPRQRGDSAC